MEAEKTHNRREEYNVTTFDGNMNNSFSEASCQKKDECIDYFLLVFFPLFWHLFHSGQAFFNGFLTFKKNLNWRALKSIELNRAELN